MAHAVTNCSELMPRDELCRREDLDAERLSQYQQVLVVGDDEFGAGSGRAGEKNIIFHIAGPRFAERRQLNNARMLQSTTIARNNSSPQTAGVGLPHDIPPVSRRNSQTEAASCYAGKYPPCMGVTRQPAAMNLLVSTTMVFTVGRAKPLSPMRS